MKCEFVEHCSFQDDMLHNKPVTAAIFKSLFCDLDFKKCARYIATHELGLEEVPPDLYPNHADRVKKIIDAKQAG